MRTKVCIRCSQPKPLYLFHNDSRGRDGKSSRCMECANRMQREREKERGGKWVRADVPFNAYPA